MRACIKASYYWLGYLRMVPSDLMVRTISLLSVSAMVRCSQAGISESRLTRGLGPQPW